MVEKGSALEELQSKIPNLKQENVKFSNFLQNYNYQDFLGLLKQNYEMMYGQNFAEIPIF